MMFKPMEYEYYFEIPIPVLDRIIGKVWISVDGHQMNHTTVKKLSDIGLESITPTVDSLGFFYITARANTSNGDTTVHVVGDGNGWDMIEPLLVNDTWEGEVD